MTVLNNENKSNFKNLIDLIINWILENINKLDKNNYCEFIKLIKNYICLNIDNLLNESKIPKESFMLEIRTNKSNLVKYLLSLISPMIKTIILMYNKDIFYNLENLLSECFENIINKDK